MYDWYWYWYWYQYQEAIHHVDLHSRVRFWQRGSECIFGGVRKIGGSLCRMFPSENRRDQSTAAAATTNTTTVTATTTTTTTATATATATANANATTNATTKATTNATATTTTATTTATTHDTIDNYYSYLLLTTTNNFAQRAHARAREK